MAAPTGSTVTALVMAGGRGERMSASGVKVPKPLVPVAGTALLEHNVRLLLHWGLRDVVVSVAAGPAGDEVGRFCVENLRPLVDAAGGGLDLLVEERPLGNIGCAGLLAGRTSTAVVVYADNLTTLDLGRVLRAHAGSGADLTLACHDQEFRIPYGRLDLDGGRVVGYTEKPAFVVPVASAVSVLGDRALRALPAHRPTGLVDLTQSLIADGATVTAYRHQAPWVDVNDVSGTAAADELVRQHRSQVGW